MDESLEISINRPTCKGYSVIVLVQRHLQYISSLLKRLDKSPQIVDIFLIWINSDYEAPSSNVTCVFITSLGFIKLCYLIPLLFSYSPAAFLPPLSKPVVVLPPFYNRQQAHVNRLPETESTAFLVLDEDSFLPEFKDLELTYRVCCCFFCWWWLWWRFFCFHRSQNKRSNYPSFSCSWCRSYPLQFDISNYSSFSCCCF